jgi:virginiamycin B lyase
LEKGPAGAGPFFVPYSRHVTTAILRRVALPAIAALAISAPAAQAPASVYWTSPASSGIGRVNLDGEALAPSFVEGLDFPCGVAVDHAHLYWGNAARDSIGRARIDGTDVDTTFVTGADWPCAVAVDDAQMYWANTGGAFGGTTIGRANLEGGGVDQSFIDVAAGPCGIAVDDAHIYWTNAVTGTIGRAELDGTGVEPSYITGADRPCGVAVTGGAVVPDRHAVVGGHIYWANTGGGFGTTIGRASLDGSAVDQDFISGLRAPWGVALSPTHVFWSQPDTDSIGRAYLDGTGRNPGFIAAIRSPFGIAADGGSVRIAVGSVMKRRGRGIAELPVTVPGPGLLEIAATRRVRADSELAAAAGMSRLTVRARGQARRLLERRGAVRVTARISFAPDGATAITQTVALRLIRR